MSLYVDVAYIKVCSIVWEIQYTHTHTRFLTELVLLRFQQSGLSRFCSSARALASMVYILLSSLFIFFHLSPRMTLMALEQENRAETKIRDYVFNKILGLETELLKYVALQEVNTVLATIHLTTAANGSPTAHRWRSWYCGTCCPSQGTSACTPPDTSWQRA